MDIEEFNQDLIDFLNERDDTQDYDLSCIESITITVGVGEVPQIIIEKLLILDDVKVTNWKERIEGD